MNLADEGQPGLAAAIVALRARGAPRVDPVRFRQAEAMARRAAGHEGEARRLMDAKLARLLAGLEQALEARTPSVAAGTTQRYSPLSTLLADIAREGSEAGTSCTTAEGSAPMRPPAELRAVRENRSTWARLGVDQRLRQSRATVPDKAGPLNTQRLMHEALTAMREASPGYLEHFITQVEALLWLDQASLPLGATKKKDAVRNLRPR